MPSTFLTPKNSKRIPNELRRHLIFLVKSAFSCQKSRRILGTYGFSYTKAVLGYTYDLRYECSSRNFFVQICKIKGAANFYPRCDKLLANSPVRYFRLLRPCMHKVVIILIFMLLDDSSNRIDENLLLCIIFARVIFQYISADVSCG